jgi:hypothetical protein
MIDKINQILGLIKEIQDEDAVIGDIILVNFKSAINTIDALHKGVPDDISEKLELLSSLLGVDLQTLVTTIIEEKYMGNQDPMFNPEEADKQTIDFILSTDSGVSKEEEANINNSKIDDYETFLKNNVKENMGFLKGEI